MFSPQIQSLESYHTQDDVSDTPFRQLTAHSSFARSTFETSSRGLRQSLTVGLPSQVICCLLYCLLFLLLSFPLLHALPTSRFTFCPVPEMDSSSAAVCNAIRLAGLKDVGVKTLAATILSLTTHANMGEGRRLTRVGIVFNMIWCFFALILVSAYTANLSAILTTSRLATDVESLEQLEVTGKHSACVRSGTAYARDMASNFPALPLVWITGISDGLNKLASDECQAIVDTNAMMVSAVNGAIDLDLSSGTSYCVDEIDPHIVGDPLKKGFTDMAVGVASTHPLLEEALSYWITVFRTCNPFLADSVCGPGESSQRGCRPVH